MQYQRTKANFVQIELDETARKEISEPTKKIELHMQQAIY